MTTQLDKAREFLNSAPTPEARQARKRAMYIHIYNAPRKLIDALESKAFPKREIGNDQQSNSH